MDIYRLVLSSLCAVGLLLIACGDTDDSAQFGEWTMTEEPLKLTADLRVSETDSFYFGGIADLSVRDDGHIAVADYKAGHVKVLTPQGSLAHVLGEKGQGPGEFQQIGLVQWARGDSLYAYDLQTSRLTVFAPDPPHSRQRTVSVTRDDGYPVRVRVVGSRITVEISSQVPPSDGEPRYRRVRLLNERGLPEDTLFTMPRQGSVVVSNDGVFQFRPIPFGRASEITLGPDDRLYTGWQDSLRVVAHGLDDSTEEIAHVPTPSVPIRKTTRDSVLNQIENADLREAAASAMPKTKAAFTNLVVADDGRLWIRRPTKQSDANTAPWWILNPDRKTIQEVRLPKEVTVEVVRDNRVYGTTSTDTGAPAVVRYRIES